MSRPTVNDLSLFLRDFLTNRVVIVAPTKTWPVYEPSLKALAVQLDALPASVLDGAPLAAKLTQVDGAHDGFGGAVFHYLEGVIRSPSTTEETREVAKTLRDAFVPTLASLRAPYADEAAAAAEQRALLPKHEAALKSFPVPAAPGKTATLYDWVLAKIEAGEQLGSLLAERADEKPASRKEAPRLLARGLGLVHRMRQTLADELGKDAALAEKVDVGAFAYFDLLTAMRARGDKSPTPPPEDVPVPPAPDATPTK